MKKLKTVLLILGVIILVGGVSGIYYYYYEGSHYFSTENAQVTANMITVTPEISGKLNEWNVKEGDDVHQGQILGKQDVSTLVSSSAMNPQSMSSAADSIVNKANIKAPIDGKIVQSNVIEGQMAAPGIEVAVIADTANFYIKANIEETSIFKIKQGQKVDIRIDAYPGQSFQGYVESIGQATTSAFNTMPSLNTSGTYSKVTQLIPVHIAVPNAENLALMPGMNAAVKIHIK